jgi:putative transposase
VHSLLGRNLTQPVAREVALPRPHTTTAVKGFKKVEHATTLIWKVLQIAESTFRRLQGAELLPAVYAGAQYVDGVQRSTSRQQQIGA